MDKQYKWLFNRGQRKLYSFVSLNLMGFVDVGYVSKNSDGEFIANRYLENGDVEESVPFTELDQAMDSLEYDVERA